MKPDVKLAKWLTALAVLIFFLLVVGGLVRNLGAGLSCPDWPLCQGRLIPAFDIRVFAEYFHRLFAASVSLLTLGLSYFIFSKPKWRKELGPYAGVALALLASQVVLGGLTVLKLLQSQIVTLHLATGSLFFATILAMRLKARRLEKNETSSTEKSWSPLVSWGAACLCFLFLQMILGGEVSSHGAGLACPDFPKCVGEWWPGFAGPQGLHFIHRLGALTVFTLVVIYVLRIFRGNLPSPIRLKAWGVLLLLLLQVSLGVGNVLFHLAVPIDVTHLAVAEGLFALILMTTYEIHSFQLRQSH